MMVKYSGSACGTMVRVFPSGINRIFSKNSAREAAAKNPWGRAWVCPSVAASLSNSVGASRSRAALDMEQPSPLNYLPWTVPEHSQEKRMSKTILIVDDEPNIVITSYSIHYTKLYDSNTKYDSPKELMLY